MCSHNTATALGGCKVCICTHSNPFIAHFISLDSQDFGSVKQTLGDSRFHFSQAFTALTVNNLQHLYRKNT